MKKSLPTTSSPVKLLTAGILLFSIFSFCAPKLLAQVPYTPFPKGDIAWQSWGHENYLPDVYHFALSIDTALVTIDSNVYNKVFFEKYGSQRFIAGVREENKKVYLFVPGLGEHLIYDFGLEIGDTLIYTIMATFRIQHWGNLSVHFFNYDYLPYYYQRMFVAKDKNIITLANGEQRDTLIVDVYAAHTYSREIGDPIYYQRGTQEWVEGLGTIGGQGFLTPLNYILFEDFDTPLYLECICQNDFKIWSTDSSTCFVCGEVKVNENVQHSINICPNPTTGQLIINNEQLIINNVEVFDVYGRKLLSHTANLTPQTVLNIAHFPAGVYFVKVFTENGAFVEKVIKN